MSSAFTSQVLTWGRLVKSWATDLDYINTDFDGQPPTGAIPSGAGWALPALAPVPVAKAGGAEPVMIPGAVALTQAEFVARMEAAGIGDTDLPATNRNVVIVQGDETTMVIRLPPRVHLQDSEATLRGSSYAIPGFYDDLFAAPGAPAAAPNMPALFQDKMRLHANRVGDYTLNNCM
jgi:hypothetical protein